METEQGTRLLVYMSFRPEAQVAQPSPDRRSVVLPEIEFVRASRLQI